MGDNMLEIEKYKNGHNYDCYLIKTDTGNMLISFEGNFDLYWRYIHEKSILDAPEIVTLEITKENYRIYEYFDMLYQNVLNKKEKDHLEFHSYLTNPQNPHALVRNGSIIWASDDFDYETASKVTITPGEDVYYITFEKSKDKSLFMTYSVRFRNSGSRYNPYNTEFMKMYLSLKNYDPENRQMHFEEFLYQQKKLKLTKGEK